MNQYTRQQWGLITGIIVCSCTLQMLPDTLQNYLRYDLMAIENGQIWRVFTGHFLHLSWFHLLSNIGALLLVSVVLAAQLRTVWLGSAIAGIALLCSCGLFVFSTYIKWYVGLSGVIHGLCMLGCALAIYEGERWAIFLAIGLFIKLALEQSGVPIANDPVTLGGDVIVDAHLWGSLAGLSIAVPMLINPLESERPVAD